MTELDLDLRSLVTEVAWPPTPDVAGRLELGPQPASRRRLLIAPAVALLAIAVALTVPQARSAILHFLHIGGVTIERVTTLPPAAQLSLTADLGVRVTTTQAARVLGSPFALPPTKRASALYELSGVVSALLADPEPTLLSESRFIGLMKKLASGSTRIESISIEPGVEGLWIAGAEHVYFGPNLPPRLAGSTLLWESGGITFRLEGRTLTRTRARELARQILGTATP
jgi:hypothetical protein